MDWVEKLKKSLDKSRLGEYVPYLLIVKLVAYIRRKNLKSERFNCMKVQQLEIFNAKLERT